jgi:hypothetical protein
MNATIPAEVKKIVTFIFPADGQGNLLRDPKTNNPTPYGTGFFVAVKNDFGQGMYGYLVTAKHVLKDYHGNDATKVYLKLNKLHGNAEFIALDLNQSGHRMVFTHSDPSVDVAVIPASPSEAIFDFKVIPEYMLTTKAVFDEFNMTEGSDVFIVGLLTTYYGERKNNPIFRFGHVAMFPDGPIDWVDYRGQSEQRAQLYLIETQSYAGNSGSPVFFSLGADSSPKGGFVLSSPVIKLSGIIRSVFNDPAFDFLQTPTVSTSVALPNIGIAAVTPSYLLDEILFSNELRKFRDDHPITRLPGAAG